MTPEQLKAEKIKEAWAEIIGHDYFVQIEATFNKDGWSINVCPTNDYDRIEIIQVPYREGGYDLWFRPLSLKGIEDNNGWHHITDKESLPEPRNHYDFISRKTGNRVKDYLPPIDSKEDKINLDFILEQYSHWRHIYEVPGPIY